ncbi:MAG: DUF4326 domain-containing protein [Alphaproteobacteria bacterium]|nr:DUF4326 domain-containing protein [Alphaproteobacteria bacterium]
MIIIKNMDFSEPYYEFDVRVDRKTIFGNPFRIDDESLRDCVLDKYQSYFHERIKKDVEFRNVVEKLLYIYEKHGRINLFCWWFPKRCHLETIKEYILSKVL